ncbi:class I adenylate-forming enzyme family protein [Acidiferrobacter sp.]
MLLQDAFLKGAAEHPDAEALVCAGERLSYRDIDERSDALAATLIARGVVRGDRVVLFMDNSCAAVIAIYAALKAGAAMVPVNPLTKSEKLAFILEDAQAKAFISDHHLRSAYGMALQAYTPSVVIVNGADDRDRQWGAMAWALATASAVCPAVPIIDQDLAAIIYTSGSTGSPKGVMLTHLNMVSAARSVLAYLGLIASDRILCCLPLAFDYGLYQVLMGLTVGACVVLERSFAFPAAVVKVVAEERVTVFPAVPTAFSILLGHEGILDAYDCSPIRIITNTAASLPPRHIERLKARFPQARIFSMYGLTECKRVSYLPPEELERRPTSVGRGMPNEEVYLVDPEGRRLPPGSVGELVVRGSHVMRGYWRRPEETAQCLKPGLYPGEMVLYSGDIFRMDEDGYLYFVGRSDDIIKSRGEKVSPKEIENVLYGMPAVMEAAVIGVDDEVLGQAVHAFVVVDAKAAITDRDVVRYCNEHLESYMVPRVVHIVPALPKTDTGKIRKAGLASLARERLDKATNNMAGLKQPLKEEREYIR